MVSYRNRMEAGGRVSSRLIVIKMAYLEIKIIKNNRISS